MKNLLIIGMTLLSGVTVWGQKLSESDLLNYISINDAGLKISALQQVGSWNYAEIKADQFNIKQTGENQQIYYNQTSIVPSNLEINIEGNNTFVEVQGNNSILDRMEIDIQGDNRNVIIRNYQ